MAEARAADGTVEYHGVNGMGLQVQPDPASGNVVLAVLGPRAGVRGHVELRKIQAVGLAADLARLVPADLPAGPLARQGAGLAAGRLLERAASFAGDAAKFRHAAVNGPEILGKDEDAYWARVYGTVADELRKAAREVAEPDQGPVHLRVLSARDSRIHPAPCGETMVGAANTSSDPALVTCPGCQPAARELPDPVHHGDVFARIEASEGR